MNASDGMDTVWPKIFIDRCESNYVVLPMVAEFFSSITGLVIAASGLVSLCTSPYSDELLDLVSATTVVNGVASTLSHATLLRVFGQIDSITITLGLLLYVKASVLAHKPQLTTSRTGRGMLNLLVMSGISMAIGWNSANLPASVYSRFDLGLMAFNPIAVIVVTFGVFTLSYGKATWHMGHAKRTAIRAVVVSLFGTACWAIEELGVFRCPSPVSLHPFWHVSIAYALMAWCAFLKYHRGLFFGFRVEIRGYWWCPYTVWLEPENPLTNPIIRHSMGIRASTKRARRNTYLAPKVARPPLSVKQAWRGESFYPGALARRLSVAQNMPPAFKKQRSEGMSGCDMPGCVRV